MSPCLPVFCGLALITFLELDLPTASDDIPLSVARFSVNSQFVRGYHPQASLSAIQQRNFSASFLRSSALLVQLYSSVRIIICTRPGFEFTVHRKAVESVVGPFPRASPCGGV